MSKNPYFFTCIGLQFQLVSRYEISLGIPNLFAIIFNCFCRSSRSQTYRFLLPKQASHPENILRGCLVLFVMPNTQTWLSNTEWNGFDASATISFEVDKRIELLTQGYKSCALPTTPIHHYFKELKNPIFFGLGLNFFDMLNVYLTTHCIF